MTKVTTKAERGTMLSPNCSEIVAHRASVSDDFRGRASKKRARSIPEVKNVVGGDVTLFHHLTDTTRAGMAATNATPEPLAWGAGRAAPRPHLRSM
jgi:hypothetical protein